MRALRLIVLVLLWGSSVLAQPGSHSAGSETRRIDLKVEPAVTPSEVRISPGLATLLLFDSALERTGTVLEGREHFREVEVRERMIVLIPTKIVSDKAPLLLTVRFSDGQAPAIAFFVLKAHPTLAERQVEVYRHARPCEASLQQAREQQAALEQCQEELSRYTAAARVPDPISELRSSGFMDENGIQVRRIKKWRTQSPGPLEVMRVRSYRSREQVAVEVYLNHKQPEDDPPWVAESAKLIGSQGGVLETLRVRQAQPEEPGGETIVWVDTKAKESSETYTLTLWDAEGTRSVTVDNVQFP